MASQLEQLKQITTVVADTGDIEAIRTFKPVDATTNPSLLLKAAEIPEYNRLLQTARDWALAQGGSSAEQLGNMTDRFAVEIGREILQLIPGRISTEVDARLSFSKDATLARARKLIRMYEALDIERHRILIKIAATWEGICAARELEREGINCNLTLLFGFEQAAACADAGVHLISPFVGRILDWYQANQAGNDYQGAKDPGVQSVSRIYHYYKGCGYDTIVMGASFRNTEEIRQLAGCDRLTIAPALMQELDQTHAPLQPRLSAGGSRSDDAKRSPDEESFRWALNEDAMATEKLAEGIRKFAIDQVKLEQLLVSL